MESKLYNTENLYLIVGPSGIGKTSIVKGLEKEYGLTPVKSYTTRKPRSKDEDGYTFISKKEFSELGEVLAYTIFAGEEYGVTVDKLNKGDVYVVDVAGVHYLKKHYSDRPIKVLGLVCSPKILEERMRNRGDSEENIVKRLKNDKIAFAGLSGVIDSELDVTPYDNNVEALVERVYKWIIWEENN